MRFSLEGRVPFLDKEVLKFIFSLSDEAIIKDGWNKRVLRDATRGLLPSRSTGAATRSASPPPRASGSCG